MRLLESFTWLHVLVISIIGGVLGGVVVQFGRPGAFTADSSLLLSDRPDVLAGGATGPASAAAAVAPSLHRLQAILVSRALRERVADRLGLAQKLGADKGEVVKHLLDITTVKSIGEDGISITVTVRGYADPRLAFLGYPISFEEARPLSADIANAFVTELAAYVRETQLEGAGDTRRCLEERCEELSGELEDIEDRLEDLRAQYELLDPESNAARVGDRIRVLEQARGDAAAEADATASALGEAEAQLAATDARRIASSTESRNPVISSLEQELTRLRVDLATELASGKTAEHRDVVQIQSAIESIEAQVAELDGRVLADVGEQPNPLYDDAIKRVVELRVQLAGARARRAENSALLAAARGEMSRMPAVAREYVAIQRDQQLRAEQVVSVERALWQARFEEARSQATEPFHVLDSATPPIDRHGPASLLAGLIGFGLLVLLQGLLVIDRRWFGG